MKKRPRRLRKSDNLRSLVRETHITMDDIVYPLFVRPGTGIMEPIISMPGQFRWSPDTLVQEVKEAMDAGVKAVLLFGLANHKDELAKDAYHDDGAVQQALRKLKQTFPELLVMTDVCVCGFTNHGHCGIVKDGHVANDETLEILAKTAITHAKAGADIVAPSAMMDGQVGAIREALDATGFSDVGIMAYSAKFWSSFYGPFREAADSAPQSGNRATYQMDTANSREALREMDMDVEEGADILMIKPAVSYLDIIYQARQRHNLPIAAYNVSAEYSMIKAAGEKGWINEKAVVMEMLTSIKRAGADIIITYFAKQIFK
ncbi:MAG: porphobilinogen synthase [Bacteroidia bacterium]